MFQPRLKLRPPIETFANVAMLAALAEAAKTLMDDAEEDRDNVRRFSRDARAAAELEGRAHDRVAKALMLHDLHNALEALLPTGLPEISSDRT